MRLTDIWEQHILVERTVRTKALGRREPDVLQGQQEDQ